MENNNNSSVQYVLDREGSKKITGFASIDRPWLKYYDVLPEDIKVPDLSLYEFIYDNNKNNLQNYALNYYHNRVTYASMFDKVSKLAYQYSKLGIKKGEDVPICMLSTPELVYSFLALNKIGAVPCMINPANGIVRLREHLKTTNAKYLITGDIFSNQINEVINDTFIDNVIEFTFANSMPNNMLKLKTKAKLKLGLPTIKCRGDLIEGDKLLNEKITGYYRPTATHEENDVCAKVYTSGTTGNPKAIMLSNKNFVSMMIEYSLMGVKMERVEKFMSVIPPFFPYGICNSICVPLSLGLETVLIAKFDATIFPKVFMEYKPQHINGVPKYYVRLMSDPVSKDADISFFKNAGCGGAGINAEDTLKVHEYFRTHGSKAILNNGYGASETASAASVQTDTCHKMGSVGIPLILSNVSIFKKGTDEELSYLEKGEGEVCISGPTVMLGYYNNEEKTKKALKLHKDGKIWYHTEDKGYMDEDGELFIIGRYGRLILRRGMSINPNDIEEELSKLDELEKVVVEKEADPEFVEVPVACLKLKSGINEQEVLAKLNQICKDTLPPYAWPHNYYKLDDVPYLPGDKIDHVTIENNIKNKVYTKILKK